MFPVNMPALAGRAVDIPALIEAMMASNPAADKAALPIFTEGAFTEMMRYPWPGNVRELRNVLERACLLFQDARLNRQM